MRDKYVIIMRFIKKYLELFSNAVKFLFEHNTLSLATITLVLLLLSYIVTPRVSSFINSVDKLENRIQQRQALLEGYAVKALENPVDEWLDLDNLPNDMVIYKYNADTLQSWANQFPISNDEVDVLSLWYRLHYQTSKSLYNTPLAYLGPQEQYVSLGSAWYVVKVYIKNNVKLITGLLIKTEYLSNNSVLTSSINSEFGIDRRLVLNPLTLDEGRIVKGLDGSVLFSVIDDVASAYNRTDSPVSWYAVLFAIFTLYSLLYTRKTLKVIILYIIGLTFLRIISFRLGDSLRLDSPLFSPNLYADKGIFSSFGNFLLNNVYVFLIIVAFYHYRNKLVFFSSKIKRWQRIILVGFLSILPIILAIYVNFTLKSLIDNSSIALELYRLDELSIYSILAYITYALLFIGLLMLLQIILLVTRFVKKSLLLSGRAAFIVLFLVSIYTLIAVSMYGYKKERERSYVWISKLSIERDISLELQLRSIEHNLMNDLSIRYVMAMNSPTESILLLNNKLDEIYFNGLNQKYQISLSLCRADREGSLSIYNKDLSNCDVFEDKILRSGIQLADNSNFFFINSYNGRVNYIGRIPYYTRNGIVNLYIEFESRVTKDVIGYPAVLFDYKSSDNVNMPASYSYAKYIDNRLIVCRGRYNYSISLDVKYPVGYSTKVKDGYLHYINASSNGTVIVISRKQRPIYAYIISFSYVMLFYGFFLFIFIRLRRFRKPSDNNNLPKNTFRRKITYLIISSLVIALICMGLGSVWFSINYYNENNRAQMEEKLLIVQNTLTELCKYANSYNEINTSGLFQSIDNLSNTTHVDINIFDPHGRLIRSTQPELFERYLLASRMNPSAYKQLIMENKRQVINSEKLAELSYYSLYAPIFNRNGKLIAIANIPYFANNSSLIGDIPSILAAIINIYILLLLLAILAGTVLSNQLSKPLAEVSRKMKFMDVSKKTEHINYKNKDELGVLVRAYNKMVDDLEESTLRLAQTEREQAWSEMARQIAHEIKNPLTPMRLSIQHLVRLKQRNIDGWEDKFEGVASSILEQIDILSDTASEFSSFAKFYYEESSVLNLYDIISDQKILFDTRDNIKILFSTDLDDCYVFARKGQIVRVLVNLITNAIQAIEAIGRGYVKVSLTLRNGSYEVSVEDSGNGVKEEDIDKLFTPNFTTKSSGTGLGLAICRNIIEQSGGKIYYSKSDMGGANFTFSLPKFRDDIEQVII